MENNKSINLQHAKLVGIENEVITTTKPGLGGMLHVALLNIPSSFCASLLKVQLLHK
jgi:hypothetical protein